MSGAMNGSDNWNVEFSASANRQKKKLPSTVVQQLARLTFDLVLEGPIQPKWSHYSQLKKSKTVPTNAYHCHIKGGRPTYVVCWQVIDKKIKIIEIFYVGTHENTPY